MIALKRINLFALFIRMDRLGIDWPVSKYYASVPESQEWTPGLYTLSKFSDSLSAPLSAVVRCFEDGDDMLTTLPYPHPEYVKGIAYTRRPILDAMVDMWRDENKDMNCRAFLLREADNEDMNINQLFSRSKPDMRMHTLFRLCSRLSLRPSDVIREFERRYIAEHDLPKDL